MLPFALRQARPGLFDRYHIDGPAQKVDDSKRQAFTWPVPRISFPRLPLRP